MDFLPIFLDVRARRAVVVGGGSRAAAKVRLLVGACAEVTVVAPEACGEIRVLAASGKVHHVLRAFTPADADGADLVFAASGKADVDLAVAGSARSRGIPVNIVDGPRGDAASTFIMPAIVDRDPVVVAVSSGGEFPGLSREVRTRIEALLPSRLGAVARFAQRFRGAVQAVIGDEPARRRLWQQVLDGPIASAIQRGDNHRATEAMLALLNRPASARSGEGVVYLIGTGAGDPDLLTLHALRVLQRADLVIHGATINAGLLDLARRDAGRLEIDEHPAPGGRRLEEINALMATAAQAGGTVVRLVAGGSFVGGETDYLRARCVAVETIPGIAATPGTADVPDAVAV